MESATSTVSVVKEDQEFWVRFSSDDPLELYQALLRMAQVESGISREEAYEVMEGLIPERLPFWQKISKAIQQ